MIGLVNGHALLHRLPLAAVEFEAPARHRYRAVQWTLAALMTAAVHRDAGWTMIANGGLDRI